MGSSNSSTPRKSVQPYPPKSILKNPSQPPPYRMPYNNPGYYPPNPYNPYPTPQNPTSPYAPRFGNGITADTEKIHNTSYPPYINGPAFSQLQHDYAQNRVNNQLNNPYVHDPYHSSAQPHSHHHHHHLHDQHHHHHHHRHHTPPSNNHQPLPLQRPAAATKNRKDAGVGDDFQTLPVKKEPDIKPLIPVPPVAEKISAPVVDLSTKTTSTPIPLVVKPEDAFEPAPHIRSLYIPRSPNHETIDNYRSDSLPVAQRVHSVPTSSGPKWYDQNYDQRVKPLVLEDI